MDIHLTITPEIAQQILRDEMARRGKKGAASFKAGLTEEKKKEIGKRLVEGRRKAAAHRAAHKELT
jgi:hypothetical protein